MPTSIPLGFHIFSATLTVTGSTHNNTFTCGGKNNLFVTAAALNTQWRNVLTATARPLNAGAIPVGWTLVETKVLANIGGVLQVDIVAGSTVGTGVTLPPPMNTALIVRKDTGFAGRPYQARLFAPPAILEGNVDAAGFITTGLPAIQNQWTNSLTDLTSTGITPVIIHNPSTGLIPTAISGFTVKNRLGTIGRRLRR